MSSGYPITRHRELGLFFWWNVLRQRRRPLAAGLDQTLVYLIGGNCAEYVAGTPEGAPAGPVLAVWIVDVRRDVPISAACHVAAGEWEFPVTATFHCTVLSPVTVVRNRRTDAIRNIRCYLHVILSMASTALTLPVRDEHSLQPEFTEVLQRHLASTPIPGVQVVLARLDVNPARYTGPGEA